MRILIIEDDPAREEKLRSWLPPHIIAVIARSVGTAMRILRRDRGKVSGKTPRPYRRSVIWRKLFPQKASEERKLFSFSIR